MTKFVTDGQTWLHDLCLQFSEITGWRLKFTSVDEWNGGDLENSIENFSSCCWSSEIHNGQNRVGYLQLELPGEPEVDRSFLAISSLADLISQLLSKHAAVSTELEMQSQEFTTLVHAGLSTPQDEDLLNSLRQLSQTALQLTGFRASAFFLLNSQTSELKLRTFQQKDGQTIPFERRDIRQSSPDREALAQGTLILRRSVPTDDLWLPDGTATGVCVPVRSDSGPLGTFWAFDRRSGNPRNQAIHVFQSIAAQIAAVLERAVLLKESEHQHRLKRELQVASETQSPRVISDYFTESGFEASALCMSRHELGGDLCELIPLNQHQTIVALGDASGNSIPAAMVMSAVRGAIKTLSLDSKSVFRTDRIMERLNQGLYGITQAHQFMSLVYGILDTAKMTFTYTNAGHPNPFFVHQENISPFISHGMLLGVDFDAPYDYSTIDLCGGDILVFYSDGVSEAMSSRQQMFRSEGILSAIQENLWNSARDVMQSIWDRMETHMAGSLEGDDRTLLVLKLRN